MSEKREIDFFEYASNALARAYAADGSLITSTYSSSTTWTCPAGVFEIIVECFGGGGSGANAVHQYDQSTEQFISGGGGGGGAYAKKAVPVTPGSTYTVSVGGAAGDSYFNSVSTVLAKGGANASGTSPGAGGSAEACVGDTTYSGGSGGSGQVGNNTPSSELFYPSGGGGGGAATASGAGTAGGNWVRGNFGQAGGSYGGGSSGYLNSSANGVAGTAPGGGGGGGGQVEGSGGSGSSGQIIISYYPVLAFSESSILSEGTYALKVSADPTNSLNKALIKTLTPTKDFQGINTLHFDIRASRTGSNVKIGIRDSGGVVTEITPNISSADTWQTVDWDISGTLNANKNALNAVIITIVNADAGNVIYIDNFYGDYTAPIYSLEDLNIELRDKDGVLKMYLTPFVSAVSWEWQRLGGCGNCTITLNKAYRWMDFAAMDDIQIRMKDGVTSKLLYRGFVQSTVPALRKDQSITLNVRGYFESLKLLVVHNSGDTKTYTSTEVSAIVTNIIDTFVTPHSFVTKGTIDTGTFTCDTIDFLGTVSDALQTLAELAGNIEYGVDEDLAFYWRTESSTLRHKFFVGTNIKSMERRVNFTKLVNKIYFIGGSVAGVKYKTTREDATSQANYFLAEDIVQNSSITTATVANQYLDTILAEKSEPEINIQAEIVNTPVRLEDTIPLGKVAFVDPDITETVLSQQVNKISYSLSNTKSRFNIKIETGDTILDTAAKIKQMDMIIKNSQQYS